MGVISNKNDRVVLQEEELERLLGFLALQNTTSTRRSTSKNKRGRRLSVAPLDMQERQQKQPATTSIVHQEKYGVGETKESPTRSFSFQQQLESEKSYVFDGMNLVVGAGERRSQKRYGAERKSMQDLSACSDIVDDDDSIDVNKRRIGYRRRSQTASAHHQGQSTRRRLLKKTTMTAE
jgi:hypothetical protein